MELKSPDRNIRILGCAGIVAGVGLVSSGHPAFGAPIVVTGVIFLLLPFLRTRPRG